MKYSSHAYRFKEWFFLTLLLSACLTKAEADFVQQGAKLVGSGFVGVPGQGASVALSGDGNTALIGGPSDSSGLGAAWVFTRSNGVWSQQGSKLVGSGAAHDFVYQGASVALSADGNTALIGGPGDSSGLGAAWVFVRSDGVWSQQGKLVGSGAVGGLDVKQGWSVALSADGNTALVGGWGDDDNAGAVWVWTRSGGVWSQQGSKLVGSGAAGISEQGWSVGLSADGNTAVVGGHYDNVEMGAAWIWTRSGGVWTQSGEKLAAPGESLLVAHQGWSVSMSGDGQTAMVGAPTDSGGMAWVWTRSGEAWSMQGGKLMGSGATGNPQHGWSVALSGDGNTAIIGGPTDGTDCCHASVGAAWMWTRSGGAWSQEGNKLVGASDSLDNARQGGSVAISSDGGTVLIGGRGDHGGIGAAWIFTRTVSPISGANPIPPQLILTCGHSLRFDLPRYERVEIRLLDANGKILSHLLDESRKAGRYSLPLPTGLNGSMDFLDYRAGDFHEALKLQP